MNKTILIGFFFALVTPSSIELRSGNHKAYWAGQYGNPLACKAGWLSLFKLYQEETKNDTRQIAPVADKEVSDHSAWLISLAVVLLAVPLYLLFLIRKRQIMIRQIDRLRWDATLLFNHAPCGYHAVDEQGYFINVNDTLLDWLGYEKEEIVGKLKFTDVVDEEENVVQEKIVAMERGKASGKVQLHLIRKTGKKFPVILREMGRGETKTNSSKRLFSTVDNTECAEALERIKHLDQELESFSYSISHDLRAPLRSIDGYSKILQEDYASQLGEEGKRVLNVIMNNAKRMGKLIDDLLEFGRLGRRPVQPSYINMTDMVNHIVRDLLSGESGRKIDVKVGALHTAFADADMIHLVWLNLLDNAFKYTGKKDLATIEVKSYKTENGQLCYEIKDNGVGFDMKYAPKLFGVFQRLHKIQDFTGTGVGLALVKRIISRHGGKVWAEGSLQNGAIFYFTIPIDNEHT